MMVNQQYTLIENQIDSIIENLKNKTTIKKDNQYQILEIVDEKLCEISKILMKYEDIFEEELTVFYEIESYIIYIVGKNCEVDNFGHLECVNYLLNIFKDLLSSKYESNSQQKYFIVLKEIKHGIDNFYKYFNENIFEYESKYDEYINRLNYYLKEKKCICQN